MKDRQKAKIIGVEWQGAGVILDENREIGGALIRQGLLGHTLGVWVLSQMRWESFLGF